MKIPVIPVIFIHKLKNKNSGIQFQERSIQIKLETSF